MALAAQYRITCILMIVGFGLIAGIHYYMTTYNGGYWMTTDNAVWNSKVSIDTEDFTIPEESVLKTTSTHDLIRLYERYTSSRQTMCRNIQRTGGIYDGGKEVCVDEGMAPKKPCLVYSFGSKNNFDFESDVISLYGCDVKTFDPSLGNAKIKNPPGCSFYAIGIDGKNGVNKRGWGLRTLSNITDMLHHNKKTIDILKMDVEGAEWSAIPDMIRTGSIKNVMQLLVEFHFNTQHATRMSKQLAVFREIYMAGFRIFQSEKNTACKNCYVMLDGRKVARLVEIAFIITAKPR